MEILAVTGTRADWGGLAPVLAALDAPGKFRVRLAVTGQHLMAGHPSLAAIREEGFRIDHEVPIGPGGDDSPAAISRALAQAVAGFADLFAAAPPDLLLILGDRYEIFAVASAALIARIPVAHLCGGDLTEGAFDDAMRHCITKLSHVHFVSNADAARRVAQLGENPEHIHPVGSTALDRLRQTAIPGREAFFATIGLAPRARNLLVAFHPVTLAEDSLAQCRAMLRALDRFADTGLIVTGSNADPQGRRLNAMLKDYAEARENAVFHDSLGSRLYAAALAYADALVGNSSSGLYEAPSMKTPSVNIGDRQAGRLRARSVIDCAPEEEAIAAAIAGALATDCREVENPYGDGYAAERIVRVLTAIGDPKALIRKTFRDLPA